MFSSKLAILLSVSRLIPNRHLTHTTSYTNYTNLHIGTMEDYNRTEASKCLEKSDTLLLLLFQISVTLVSDI